MSSSSRSWIIEDRRASFERRELFALFNASVRPRLRLEPALEHELEKRELTDVVLARTREPRFMIPKVIVVLRANASGVANDSVADADEARLTLSPMARASIKRLVARATPPASATAMS
jgi:hypothetical protein